MQMWASIVGPQTDRHAELHAAYLAVDEGAMTEADFWAAQPLEHGLPRYYTEDLRDFTQPCSVGVQ